MKQISLSLSISLMIVTLIFGLMAGYYISPTYQQSMFETEMGLGEADKFVDLRYINQMATHHMGAIKLAQMVQDNTQRDEIKKLSEDIQKGEPKLIEELFTWKKEWYKDFRNFNDPEVPNIGGRDEKTDLRFLNALIAHHEAGIEMAKEAKIKSSKSEILDNADAVEKFLSDSLVTLTKMRADWYNIQ